jgi:hypothetical protein
MTKDEAFLMAIEALDNADYHRADEAITAIKAALEAKDEPVAWAMLHDNGHFIDAIHPNEHARVEGEYITPLYTTPPQRTWVGLMDVEIVDIMDVELTTQNTEHFALCQAIEAKLKEKNT